jgi:hypothetical protein
MPGGMNGVQLAAEAARIRPAMKVLLTSGYTGQALAGKEGLPAGLALPPNPTAVKSWRTISGSC